MRVHSLAAQPEGRFHRRAVLTGGAALLAGAWLSRPQTTRSQDVQVQGDCTSDPAVAALLNLATGNYYSLPYIAGDSIEPPFDWQMAETANVGVIMLPPTWSATNMWANSLAQDGTPDWQQTPMPPPAWSAAVLAPADQSASYINVTGVYDGAFLTIEDGLSLMRSLVVGPDAQVTPVCVASSQRQDPQNTSLFWVASDTEGQNSLISRGFLIHSQAATVTLGPGTVFGIDIMHAPSASMEQLMHDVFLRIQWQLLPKGGGDSSTPTPTPTLAP